jgi:hypothetical protein
MKSHGVLIFLTDHGFSVVLNLDQKINKVLAEVPVPLRTKKFFNLISKAVETKCSSFYSEVFQLP